MRSPKEEAITTNNGGNIWDRLHPDILKGTVAQGAVQKPISDEDSERSRKKFWRTVTGLDVLGALFWTYVLIKVFAWDPDVALVSAVAPDHPWIVNLRILLFLGCLLAMVFIGRKMSIVWMLYLLFWVPAWAFWRIPRLIYKKRAWNILLALVQTIVAAFFGVVPALCILTAVIASAFIVGFAHGTLALIGSAFAFGAWAVTFFFAFRAALKPARFLDLQERALNKLRRSSESKTGATTKRPNRRRRRGPMSKEASEKFVQAAGYSLLRQKAIYLWAAKVNDYKRSPATFVYGPLSTIGLLVWTTILFALVNLGLFHYDVSQFTFDPANRPSFLKFMYYSLTGLYSGEISGLTPAGSIAIIAKILLTFIGASLIVVLLAGLFQNYRTFQDAEKADKVVKDMRAYVRKLESEFRREYYLSPAEALVRLRAMGSGIVTIIGWMGVQATDSIGDGGETRRIGSGRGPKGR